MQQLRSSEHIFENLLYKKSIDSISVTSITCIYNSKKRYAMVAGILISQLASFKRGVLATLILQLISNHSIWKFVNNHKIASNKSIFS